MFQAVTLKRTSMKTHLKNPWEVGNVSLCHMPSKYGITTSTARSDVSCKTCKRLIVEWDRIFQKPRQS